MSLDDLVLFERVDHVAVLTINRPAKLNALNADVLAALDARLDALEGDRSVRVVVVTGAGSKAFVAGADIRAMQDFTAPEAQAFAAVGQRVLSRLENLPQPSIAAVQGYALGGGCELAMACDLILAGEKAVFGQPEVKIGVIPGFGGTQRLARLVGPQRALEICLTARNVDADEAVAIGLALRKVEGDVRDAALKLAATIASRGPFAVRTAKRAIRDTLHTDLESGLAAERALFGLCFATEDQTEGMSAFLDKRKVAFTDR